MILRLNFTVGGGSHNLVVRRECDVMEYVIVSRDRFLEVRTTGNAELHAREAA